MRKILILLVSEVNREENIPHQMTTPRRMNVMASITRNAEKLSGKSTGKRCMIHSDSHSSKE